MLKRRLYTFFYKAVLGDTSYKLAQECVLEVRKKISRSETFLSLHNDESPQREEEIKKVSQAINLLRKRKDLNSSAQARIALEQGVGNCYEMANATFLLLNEKCIWGNIETFIIKNGDHVFNVINRPTNSNPNDPSTWGDAIIVDSWANKVFPAKDILQNLNNYKCTHLFDSADACKKATLMPYDPKIHILSVIESKFNMNKKSLLKF